MAEGAECLCLDDTITCTCASAAQRRYNLGGYVNVESSLHAGKKAAAAKRASRVVKAAPVEELGSSSKADATVTRKRARERHKADKAVAPAKEARKGRGKKAAVAAKDAAREAATTEAAAASEKPRAPSTRARKPSAIVVGTPKFLGASMLVRHCASCALEELKAYLLQQAGHPVMPRTESRKQFPCMC